jgi:hypothetical protein
MAAAEAEAEAEAEAMAPKMNGVAMAPTMHTMHTKATQLCAR